MKQNYKTIEQIAVWKLSHEFVLEIYQVTRVFPKHELIGLISQLRRAAVSIPSNIAEGCGRRSTKELIQFLYLARGSLGEVRYQLMLSHDLNYLSDNEYQHLFSMTDDIGKQLNGWIKSLKAKL